MQMCDVGGSSLAWWLFSLPPAAKAWCGLALQKYCIYLYIFVYREPKA